ncbi:MAG: class I tRNA ligase family protein, partial [Candidatus Omnitrophica bacterium]|nr:class I tRNA ligase family protein [Candidatus Omnitrophota bacterium]
LVTAPEIIFFWVARMIMAGLEFRGEIPFKDVYIHGTVRDDKGTKMSKSLGNVIDPLEIIEDYGTDALRFSLMAITSVGQDVFLSRDKFELGRNFANKIWNASRFILMNVADKPFNKNILSSFTRSTLDLPENQANTPLNTLSLADKWILSRLSQAMDQVTESLNKYRFNEATSLLYDFFWHEFCDWYLEMVKPLLYDQQNEDQAATARAVLCYVLEKSLRILHPFMPFITEEIWQNLKQTEYAIQQPGKSIMTAQWPKANKELSDKKIEKDFSLVIEIITAIRNIRSSVSIKPSDKIETLISVPGEDIKETLLKYKDYLISLSGIKDLRIDINIGKPKMSGSAVISGIAIYVPLEGLIDIDQEKERLNKQIEKLQPQLKGIQKKLDNDNFISKAPEEVVKKEKTKEQDLIETIQKLNSLLLMLE